MGRGFTPLPPSLAAAGSPLLLAFGRGGLGAADLAHFSLQVVQLPVDGADVRLRGHSNGLECLVGKFCAVFLHLFLIRSDVHLFGILGLPLVQSLLYLLEGFVFLEFRRLYSRGACPLR